MADEIEIPKPPNDSVAESNKKHKRTGANGVNATPRLEPAVISDTHNHRKLREIEGLAEKEGLLFFRFVDDDWETALDHEREERLASLDDMRG